MKQETKKRPQSEIGEASERASERLKTLNERASDRPSASACVYSLLLLSSAILVRVRLSVPFSPSCGTDWIFLVGLWRIGGGRSNDWKPPSSSNTPQVLLRLSLVSIIELGVQKRRGEHARARTTLLLSSRKTPVRPHIWLLHLSLIILPHHARMRGQER